MNQAGARALQRVDEYEERFVSRPHLELVEEPPAAGERRTVRISGQSTPPRRRDPVSSGRVMAAPDRLALYAVLLGLFLVFMAIITASS
ncbi:MAG: hypothetical protein M3375_08885 [Actinomycetota bacterium]|nr:hypothetical protein [Actinomycetota bacterium]